MILQSLILTIFLSTFATRAAVLDQEPPVFTYCPSKITIDNATTLEIRVYWQEPTATDNSGVLSSVTSTRRSGDLFAVPGTYEVLYTAKDESGNEAICSFRITLRRKTCPLYAAPKNGALACNKIGSDYVCAVMCKNGFDFSFNPPMVYFCSSGIWNFFSLPLFPFSKQLPWPDCSKATNPSSFKQSAYPFFFFDGCANSPNVQTVIKANFISLMKSGWVPPLFCPTPQCTADNIEVFAGFSDQKPPVFTFCPSDIVMDNLTSLHVRVNWQQPTVTDNSGVPPSLSFNRPSGDNFLVPGSYEVLYKATDESGNEATCSFRITLKSKTCPLYAAPKNGALACNKIGSDYVCAVMCKNGFDFSFDPPLVYFCSSGIWNFFSLPTFPFSKQLPWPDCSKPRNPSNIKQARLPYFFFDGDANDPNVQAAIKTDYISFMTTSNMVPPIFCPRFTAECKEDNIEVYAGS